MDASTHLFTLLSNAHRMPEKAALETLLHYIELSDSEHRNIRTRAKTLIEAVRNKRLSTGGIEAFMMEYDLSAPEGISLMCLAEALLRIPDSYTANHLIEDKIVSGNWAQHAGESHALFVNTATTGLRVARKILAKEGMVKNISEPLIRTVLIRVMKALGDQFVLGQTITEAQHRAKKREAQGYRHSYDMLGEAAKTEADALHYLKEYETAIHSIGKNNTSGNPIQSAGISIKLSALHPRYESAKSERVMTELLPRLVTLCALAKQYQIGLTIDAEEVDRLELSLRLLEKLALNPELAGWNGLGLAIQAYSKRTFYLIDWLADLARRSQRRLMVRLVKGAYWDSEIKWSQIAGFNDYPVFTRKIHTDVSYLACAQKLLSHTDCFYPQFATHNALSLSAILELAGEYRDFEFQCLHGMGDTLYDEIVGAKHLGIPCRTYAPVGPHKHLLAYLVRRLLENGANSSFVNRIADPEVPVDLLLEDPIVLTQQKGLTAHPHIPSPPHLYGEHRLNAKSIDLNNEVIAAQLIKTLETEFKKEWLAQPLMANPPADLAQRSRVSLYNPANRQDLVGQVIEATASDVTVAMAAAKAAFPAWDKTPAHQRAAILNKAADLLEARMEQYMALAIRKAGKSIPNAIAEVREAIDFCRYYAQQAIEHFEKPTALPGPTGESNQLKLSGRGVVICISPWNFPLAIFLGEVTAALAAGNTVIAKAAEQTPFITHAAIELLHEAGVPKGAVQFLPGPGETVGAALIAHPDVAGVIFTGSTETARIIQTTLSQKPGPMVPFIAETGGQNCMIVDSSALPEQVVSDVINSAFDSAGQRCSALRVLYVQNEMADAVINMLSGAMDQLTVGNPALLATDIGPVIDQEAQGTLMGHIEKMKSQGKLIKQLPLPENAQYGTFVPPTAFEISSIKLLPREVFGPVLHVIRFDAKQLDQVIEDINGTGYGLTFGLHSRIQNTVDYITQRIRAGNIYINRNIVGAVVGVQPFGGEGLSGTGPKAGGPHYLLRLATERTISINTTAAGGNASLMSLQET